MAHTGEPGCGGTTAAGGPVAVTVVAGLDRDLTSLLASGLLTRAERTANIWVDPTTAHEGHVLWRVEDDEGRLTTGRVHVVGGCLPCAVRAAVVQRLLELRRVGRCRTAVVELHPAVEADAFVASLCAGLDPEVARVDTVAAVLDGPTWLDDLAGHDDLLSRGLALGPRDARSVSGVLAAALEVADRIVVSTPASAVQHVPQEQWTALRALAPDARRIVPPTVLDVAPAHLLSTGGHDPRCLHPLAERGLLDWTRPAVQSGSVRVVRWSRRDRPLHPARLAETIDALADGVIRSAGLLWFAHAHDAVVRWDSCGEDLHLGAVASFENAGPVTGNRLAFLGDDLDRAAIVARLERCVLTDDEMGRSPEAWAALDHPLPAWRPEPDDPSGFRA